MPPKTVKENRGHNSDHRWTAIKRNPLTQHSTSQQKGNRMYPIVLASSSPYRRDLLNRLKVTFEHCAPAIDELPYPGEAAAELVARLSLEKAQALRHQYPAHLVIGSDQVATFGEQILGKPMTHERAFAQLKEVSGGSVRFLTGLTLLNTYTAAVQTDVVMFTVHFRTLDNATIERYLRTEEPYDCAGSFKAEGLGVSLFRGTEGADASSLIGLPLIRLIDMLHQEGVHIP
jgi:MAF protein